MAEPGQRQHQDHGRSVQWSEEYNQRHGQHDGRLAVATQCCTADLSLHSPAVRGTGARLPRYILRLSD